MKVYVASKFENKLAVREFYKKLIYDGHTITHDWTNEDASGLVGVALEDYLNACANKDVGGVLDGEAFVLLHYEKISGAASEFGIAIADQVLRSPDKLIVIVDGHHPEKPRNIFFHLAYVRHVKDEDEARAVLKAHERALREG